MNVLTSSVETELRQAITNTDLQKETIKQETYRHFRQWNDVSKKYNSTGNTEYLVDASNYLMFEFMYPQHPKAHFKATDSKDSAGIVGISVKEMEDLKNEKI